MNHATFKEWYFTHALRRKLDMKQVPIPYDQIFYTFTEEIWKVVESYAEFYDHPNVVCLVAEKTKTGTFEEFRQILVDTAIAAMDRHF